MSHTRFKPALTNIPGVYFITGTAVGTDKPERIYYVSYYRDGKRHFEKAGRQFQDAMTPARANAIRTDRRRGKELPNRERRAAERAAKEAGKGRWTIERLWKEYVAQRYRGKADLTDKANYRDHLKNHFGRMEPSELVPLDVDRELLRGHPREGRNPYVFAGERKGPRGIKQIANSSRQIRAAAGLPEDFRPLHGLRHTFASHLASSGEVDLYTLQRLMTHKSPIMTQRYAHLRDEALKHGANVMSRTTAAAEVKASEKAK